MASLSELVAWNKHLHPVIAWEKAREAAEYTKWARELRLGHYPSLAQWRWWKELMRRVEAGEITVESAVGDVEDALMKWMRVHEVAL